MAMSNSVVFDPPTNGWVSLLSGSVRESNWYRNESQGVIFDWVHTLDADVGVSVELLPDSWFRYQIRLRNRSVYPLRECRLLVGKRVRSLSDGWIHDRDAVVKQWSQVDGQLPYQVLIQVGNRSGTANLRRVGLMPSESVQVVFESPDPPRPSWVLLRADGWVYDQKSDRMGGAPQNGFVRVPSILPVGLPNSPGVFLDTLLSAIANTVWLHNDRLLTPVTRARWNQALSQSFKHPTHAGTVQQIIREVQELPLSWPIRDMLLANLMYYDRVMIPTPSRVEMSP